MKAIVLGAFGSAKDLSIQDVPELVPQPDQVVIGVQAVPVNFVDTLVISGKYQFLPKLPFSPGKGPSGIVIRCGSAVSELKVGDRVLAMAEEGGYAQQVVVSANQCYRLPASMGFEAAASMSLCFDTAWFALRERARIQSGETVLILGASGAVGFACVALAKAMGASTVLAGVFSPVGADLAKQAGADVVIDLSMPNLRDGLREKVHEVTEGRGADVVIDMLGGDIFAAALRALAWCGRLVVVGFAAGSIPSLKVNYLLLKNIEVSGLQISDYRKRHPDLVRQCFEEIFQLYEAQQLIPVPWDSFDFSNFEQAIEAVLNRQTKRRIVLTNINQ